MLSQTGTREPQDLFRVRLEVEDFLYHEAQLLDENRYREWFELLAPEIIYRIPVRVTREKSAGFGFSREAFHMDEDWGSLEKRINRLETDYAWAEDPPSRTRRYVTNVRVEPGESQDQLKVRANLLVYRGRYDSSNYNLIPAERHDSIRQIDGQWRIARRLVLLDQTTLATHNLGIFL